jgi:hypothetical protein
VTLKSLTGVPSHLYPLDGNWHHHQRGLNSEDDDEDDDDDDMEWE